MGDADYKYDASGNPVSMRDGDSDRTLKYDAENRLRVIEDTQNGTMSLYTYNHTGERSLKRYGAFNTAYVNGAYAGSGLDGLTRYSAYISPYYDPSTTLWLGVDPLQHKYPEVSPYVYCHGNPVLLIDEDGRESRSWEDRLGDNLREITGLSSEIAESQSLKPVAEGVVLLNPVIGITNDFETLTTETDIYGNE